MPIGFHIQQSAALDKLLAGARNFPVSTTFDRQWGGGSAGMPSDAYQFRVSLREISPTIWRQIQVPTGYILWDLHVAIQDCMGWKDYHLHAFRFQRPGGGKN